MRRSERRRKRMQLIFGGIIVFLMVFGVFGIVLSYHSGGVGPTSTTLEYNDYTFRSTPQGYEAKIDGVDYTFTSFPGGLTHIELPQEAAARIQSTRMVYLTADPEEEFWQDIGAAQFYMQQDLDKYKGIYSVVSTTKNTSFELPIISCSDATPSVPVLDFRVGNATEITMEGDCIVLTAPTGFGFVNLKDRIIFSLLGVMP